MYIYLDIHNGHVIATTSCQPTYKNTPHNCGRRGDILLFEFKNSVRLGMTIKFLHLCLLLCVCVYVCVFTCAPICARVQLHGDEACLLLIASYFGSLPTSAS